jgi:hypothetical protein
MFGRIFGRGKDDQDQAVCAHCGRTLLAGEWTQTVVDEHGDERLICSLCGQAYSGVSEPIAAAPAPANNGRVRETRSESRPEDRPAPADRPPAPDSRAESDAFWQALKDKDAQIEGLKAELARAEAERQELAGRFARLGAETAAAAGADDEPGSLTGDSSEPGERTWGETPAEFAAEMAALRESEAAATPETSAVFGDVAPAELPLQAAPVAQAAAVAAVGAEADVADADAAERPADDIPAGVAASEAPAADDAPSTPPAEEAGVPAPVSEDTQPIPAVSEEMLDAGHDDEDDASTGEIAASDAAAAVVAGDGALPGEPVAEEPPARSAAQAEEAAALTLLQRGVDLLNVSRVPRKITETNEQLGLPHVHVGCDGEIVSVTFMWTMGWYRFNVDFESGDVTMDDRGYEELTDLQPNAGVRADGTVQLAPAQISRAAAQRAQAAPDEATAQDAQPAAREAAASPAAEPETPREAAQKPPEFLSKSLLGQRSDDETASWEQTKARDFDWDR